MAQLELNFNRAETGITLDDLEKHYHPDPDAIVRSLAESYGALDLFDDDPEPSLSIDDLNSLFQGHGEVM